MVFCHILTWCPSLWKRNTSKSQWGLISHSNGESVWISLGFTAPPCRVSFQRSNMLGFRDLEEWPPGGHGDRSCLVIGLCTLLLHREGCMALRVSSYQSELGPCVPHPWKIWGFSFSQDITTLQMVIYPVGKDWRSHYCTCLPKYARSFIGHRFWVWTLA